MKMQKQDTYFENSRIYDRYIRSRRRCNDKTKKKKMQYLMYLENFLEGKSLKRINYGDIINFQDYLNTIRYKGNPLVQSTIISVINEIGYFFEWLRHIPGYKRNITYEIVDYFKLSNREKKRLRGSKKNNKSFPRIDDIHRIIESIPSDTMLDRRLIALIAYLFLTGSRIEAAATMIIGLVDTLKRIVFQDPQKGVITKFKKYIETTIPYFDEELFQLFATWINERKKLGAGDREPLFPAAKSMKEEGYIQFGASKDWSNQFMNPKSLNKLVKEACRNAGFPDFHCHSFRDSHIYYGLKSARNYIELKAVSFNVGHESIETTISHYADLAPKEVHEIISKLGENNNSKGIPGELEEKFKSSLKTWEPELYEKYYGKGAKDEL